MTTDFGDHRLTAPGELWGLDGGDWAVDRHHGCVRFLLWHFETDEPSRNGYFLSTLKISHGCSLHMAHKVGT